MPHKTTILTGPEVKKALDMRRVMATVQRAYAAHGRGTVQMPPKIYLHLTKYDGDFRAMPAYIEGMEACGIKWVNVHPRNRMHGLPAVMALIILSDPRTGFPLAVMDGTYITNMRTGAAGAVAAKHLGRKGSSTIGLVGCGVQARFQLEAISRVFNLKKAALYDTERPRAIAFARHAKKLVDEVAVCGSVEECVRGKDIVVTTTPSRRPIVKASWVDEGTHINAIGADAEGKQELEPALLRKSAVIVDDIAQAAHSGEINVPVAQGRYAITDVRGTIGQVITGKRRGRRSDREITIFDSTGLAILDIAVARDVYKACG